VDAAAELLNKNLDQVFDDKGAVQSILTLLYKTTASAQQLCLPNQNPTPEQLATGEKAAKMLMDFNRKPEGVADAAWASARGDLQKLAKATLMAIAVKPAEVAMAKSDCNTAVNVYTKALGDFPDQSFISYNLGRTLKTCAASNPSQAAEMNSRALYEFIRAAVIDPSLGGSADAKKISDYADSAYKTYHGSDEGLTQLKEQAKATPLAPAGFKIKTATEIANEQAESFKAKYPEVALWLGIKGQLADQATGTQYFEGQLKDAAVPELKGTVVEGKPACRSKEILVAVPLPDQASTGTPAAEITLKLDAPLTGKPEPGQITWKGVPSAFTQSPFMLTMDTEKANIKDLKVSACTAAPARGAARGGKKGTSKKK